MLYGENSNEHSVKIDQALIKESTGEKLLGVILDKKLSFETHVQQLCTKARQKLHELTRIPPFMDAKKLVTVMNTFIAPQFDYCPLIWMFHSRKIDHKIYQIHEKALKLA